MAPLNHKITLQVGDPGGDGHGQSELFVYDCNHTSKEVQALYAKSVKAHKLDITGECTDYECHKLRNDFVEKFNKVFAGNDAVLSLIGDSGWGTNCIGSGEHAEIYLHIARLSNEYLHWQETDDDPTIRIGGYGYYE